MDDCSPRNGNTSFPITSPESIYMVPALGSLLSQPNQIFPLLAYTDFTVWKPETFSTLSMQDAAQRPLAPASEVPTGTARGNAASSHLEVGQP